MLFFKNQYKHPIIMVITLTRTIITVNAYLPNTLEGIISTQFISYKIIAISNMDNEYMMFTKKKSRDV